VPYWGFEADGKADRLVGEKAKLGVFPWEEKNGGRDITTGRIPRRREKIHEPGNR